MVPTRITTHVSDGIALLPDQFKGRPVIAGLLTAFLTGVQGVEDALWDVAYSRVLDNPLCVGAQLDMLGRLVGEKRLARADADYSLAIRLRIRANRSQGLAEDILDLLHIAQGPTSGVFSYTESYPAGFYATAYNVTAGASSLKAILDEAKAAATRGVFVTSNWTPTQNLAPTSRYGTASASYPSSRLGGTASSYFPVSAEEIAP